MKRVSIPKSGIPNDQLSTVYNLVEQAIQNTDLDGRTTNEVFGEIYTRFRTDVMVYGANESLKRLFTGRLKHLNGTEVGKKLDEIINELYLEQVENESSIMDLELCTVIMNDCLLNAKEISGESERIISNLEQIDNDLSGGI